MFYIKGNQVIINHLMADFTYSPERQIYFKRWMVGKCYCRRVNKKWIKRYGVKRERLFLMGHGSIIASPANVEFLRQQIEANY